MSDGAQARIENRARATAAGEPRISARSATRSILDRLGDPWEIVAEGVTVPVLTEPRLRWVEVAALVLLPIGGFIAGIGWVVGVVLLWISDRWTAGQKLLGTLVFPFGLAPAFLGGGLVALTLTEVCHVSIGTTATEVCETTGPPAWVGFVVLAVLVIAPIAVVSYLAKSARPGGSSSA